MDKKYSVIQYDRLDSVKRRMHQVCSVGYVAIALPWNEALSAAREHKRKHPLAGRVILPVH